MAVTLAGLAGARLAVTDWIRPHLIPPAHLALPIMPFIRLIPFYFGSGARPAWLDGPGRAPGSAGLLAHVQQTASPGPHYWAVVGRLPNVPGAWVYSDRLADAAGHTPSSHFLAHTACVTPSGAIASPTAQANSTCLAELAARLHQLITLQPASRYWAFQAYETAIFTAAALLLAGACFWWIRHRLT